MNLAELVNNEDFKGLGREEQRKVLLNNDDYSVLPKTEQDKVLDRVPGGFATSPEGETQLREGKPIREFLRSIYTPVLEFGGLALGATAGLVHPLLASPMAGGGYASGRAIARGIDIATGLEEPDITGGMAGEAKTFGKDVAVGSAIQMAGESLVPALKAPIEYVGKRAAANQSMINREMAAIAEREGFNLTAAQQTGSPAMSRAEMVGRWFLTAGGEFSKRDAAEASKWITKRQRWIDALGEPYPGLKAADQAAEAGMVIKKKVDELVKRSTAQTAAEVDQVRSALLKSMGSTEPYSELGKTGQEIIKARNIKDFERAGRLYDKARQFLTGEERIAPSNLKTTAQKIIDEEMKIPPSDRNTGLINRLRSYTKMEASQEEITKKITKDMETKRNVDAWVSQAQSMNPSQSIQDLRAAALQAMEINVPYESLGKAGMDPEAVTTLRAHFRSAIESADTAVRKDIAGAKFMSSKEGGVYKRLQGALYADEDAFAASIGGEYQRAYTLAKGFYRKKTTFWNDPDVLKMMTEKPEYLLDYIADAGSKTVPEKFKQAIGVQGVQKFKDKLTSRLFNVDKPSPFDPDAVVKNIAKYGETLTSFYSPKEISLMVDAANFAKGIGVKNIETNQYFVNLLKKSPEKVAEFIMGTENLPLLGKLKSVVGNETMNRIRATFLSNELELNIYGMMAPSELNKTLSKYGKNKLDAFLGKDLTQNIIDMNKIGAVTKTVENIAKNPSGTGQALISYFTLIQAGADLAKGNLWGVIKSLWPPNIIAKAYLSKEGTRLLSGSASIPAHSPTAAEVYIKLLAIVDRDVAERGKYPYRKQD